LRPMKNKVITGPFSEADMREMIVAEKIQRESLVSTEEGGERSRCEDIPLLRKHFEDTESGLAVTDAPPERQPLLGIALLGVAGTGVGGMSSLIFLPVASIHIAQLVRGRAMDVLPWLLVLRAFLATGMLAIGCGLVVSSIGLWFFACWSRRLASCLWSALALILLLYSIDAAFLRIGVLFPQPGAKGGPTLVMALVSFWFSHCLDRPGVRAAFRKSS